MMNGVNSTINSRFLNLSWFAIHCKMKMALEEMCSSQTYCILRYKEIILEND